MSRFCWTVVPFLLLNLGCGSTSPATVPAKGRVIFQDGKPVAGGVIEFVPTNGGDAARAKIGADGRFELKTGDAEGAILGTYTVVIVANQIVDGAAAHVQQKHAAMVVHPKYSSARTSGLMQEVKPGANDFLITVDPAELKRGW
ncbi:MAG: carboxypeptidase-like regulatory domain-containing protein [Gemmataceae bacterium]